jgi:SAM-dependent methyltransferase
VPIDPLNAESVPPMNPREYEIMARVESWHWWYEALRQQLADSLRRWGQDLPAHPSILDAGCGTGENLRCVAGWVQPSYVGGFDPEPLALSWAQKKVPGGDLYLSDVCQPRLHCERYDIVLSCDVLYIPGLAAAQQGMQQIVERMSPGGLLLINLPAYNWLRSDHDLAIGTRQRFVAAEVRDFLGCLGLEPKWVSYRLCLLFPLVVLSRLPSILFPSRDARSTTSALTAPNRWVNAGLQSVMRVENLAMRSGVRFPWGSSVFAVGQKKAGG